MAAHRADCRALQARALLRSARIWRIGKARGAGRVARRAEPLAGGAAESLACGLERRGTGCARARLRRGDIAQGRIAERLRLSLADARRSGRGRAVGLTIRAPSAAA